MMVRVTARAVALGLLCAAIAAPQVLQAQGPDGRWPLQPTATVGRLVAPFLEGWYVNDDGTYGYSFGYLNLNDEVVEIPVGEGNVIDPAQFNGMQPTTFLPGKHRGMFTVTVPASMRDDDVWWTITNPGGEVTKVPGRTVWNAYQLDWNPRPHGAVPPRVSFDDGNDEEGSGPSGIMSERTLTTTVGAPLTLSVDVREVSVRDAADPRFREPTSLQVVWSKYQGPVGGEVEFTRHGSTPIPPEPEEGRRGGGGGGGDGAEPAGPETILVPEGHGTVLVVATFSQAGEYLVNAQVDNFRSVDSSSGNQCCWTNGYVRVSVR